MAVQRLTSIGFLQSRENSFPGRVSGKKKRQKSMRREIRLIRFLTPFSLRERGYCAMPLLDHFHPPLSERRHWHSFHNSWATYLSSRLNALLPAGYFAEANVQFGVEIDVAAFQELGAAGAPAGWTPPPPSASFPLEMSGVVVEVGIFSRSGGPQLAGAVELVSPAN